MVKKCESEWNSHEGECLLVRKVDTFCKNSLPVEHERETKSQKIGAFLLQIVFFLTDFAEFRVKLVFCIQAETIISSISKDIPLLRDDQKSSWKSHFFEKNSQFLRFSSKQYCLEPHFFCKIFKNKNKNKNNENTIENHFNKT